MSKVEVKNMNSFRAVHNALKYEVDRQTRIVEDGGKVAQETRGWVEERNTTVSQRSKEHAHDYRYFPEPDLPPLKIDPAWVNAIKAGLPELPAHRRSRFVREYGLPLYDASLLTGSRATADYFENCLSIVGTHDDASLPVRRAKTIGNWIIVELSRRLNLNGIEISDTKVAPTHLVELVELIESGTVSTTLAKAVLEECFDTGATPEAIVKERGYVQISDSLAVESAVDEAIGSNPQAVSDYLKGKDTASKFLVGQVMKITGGKAKPALVNELVKKKLEATKAS
jgi:aspartyl-tRNA(Asn)/glutamyl-tRNA(Gln) amidotransferase subunit B